jgi:hypothetical protein
MNPLSARKPPLAKLHASAATVPLAAPLIQRPRRTLIKAPPVPIEVAVASVMRQKLPEYLAATNALETDRETSIAAKLRLCAVQLSMVFDRPLKQGQVFASLKDAATQCKRLKQPRQPADSRTQAERSARPLTDDTSTQVRPDDAETVYMADQGTLAINQAPISQKGIGAPHARRFAIQERDLIVAPQGAQLHGGQPIDVAVDAYPVHMLQCDITTICLSLDRSLMITIKTIFHNRDDELRPRGHMKMGFALSSAASEVTKVRSRPTIRS